MKIIYHPLASFSFLDFGILIPIVDNRASDVFQLLQKKCPSLEFCPWPLEENLSQEDLLLCHEHQFIKRLYSNDREDLKKELQNAYELDDRYFDFTKAKRPLEELLPIILYQGSFTYLAMKEALKGEDVFFLGGGMHHAMSFSGRGFCLINDIVIGLRKLQKNNLIQSAWVIDVDAHKGDGTAELTYNDESIRTFSIHMKNGWPLNALNKNHPSFIPSDMDIEVEANDSYLEFLEKGLELFAQKFPLPDLAIIVAGADPYVGDTLESAKLLQLSKKDMLLRDEFVYHFLDNKKIKKTYVMAGGYGPHVSEIYYQFIANHIS